MDQLASNDLSQVKHLRRSFTMPNALTMGNASNDYGEPRRLPTAGVTGARRCRMAVMTPLTSRADVVTATPARYAKQLVSHLGRRIEWSTDGVTWTATI